MHLDCHQTTPESVDLSDEGVGQKKVDKLIREQIVPVAVVLAFSVGNVPEALSSAAGMRAAGRGYTYIVLSGVRSLSVKWSQSPGGISGSIGLVRGGHRGFRH
jgi:hypothetical protein